MLWEAGKVRGECGDKSGTRVSLVGGERAGRLEDTSKTRTAPEPRGSGTQGIPVGAGIGRQGRYVGSAATNLAPGSPS